MRFYHSVLQMPENAVFWLLLLSLAVGSASSLYKKAADKAAINEAAAEYYTAAPVMNSQPVASIKDSVSLELPYRCQIYPSYGLK